MKILFLPLTLMVFMACNLNSKKITSQECAEANSLSFLNDSISLEIPAYWNITDTTTIREKALVYHLDKMNNDTSSFIFIAIRDYSIYPDTKFEDVFFFKEMRAKMDERKSGILKSDASYYFKNILVNFLEYFKYQPEIRIAQYNGSISFLLSATKRVEIDLRVSDPDSLQARKILECIFHSLRIK